MIEGDHPEWSQPVRLAAASAPRSAGRPRSRAEVDNALHGIGLALDALLDGLTDELFDTALLPVGREPQLDERLRVLVTDSGVDVEALAIVVEGERVTITGRVRDALSRLLVEDLVWSLPNVEHCENQLALV
jgi:hypothetical protein